MGKGKTLLCLTAFGVAFGYLEAAVVVYLRGLFYGGGFDFPLKMIPAFYLGVEIVREAATILMLIAVAVLPGGVGRTVFARFLFIFGMWDIFYYLSLKLLLAWPPSLGTWDVLFLIPVPWAAPVWAPSLVALLFIVAGAAGILRGTRQPRMWHYVAALSGAAAVTASFLWNYAACVRGGLPACFPSFIFIPGFLAMALTAFSVLRSPNCRV